MSIRDKRRNENFKIISSNGDGNKKENEREENKNSFWNVTGSKDK